LLWQSAHEWHESAAGRSGAQIDSRTGASAADGGGPRELEIG